jgi:hypothetical protein
VLLSGCTGTKEVIENRNIDIDEIPSWVISHASGILSENEGFYYIGTGITVDNLSDDGEILDFKTTVYPVYEDDRLYRLIIVTGEESELFSFDMVRTTLNTDEKYLLIRNNGRLIKISEEGESVIGGEQNVSISDKVIKKARKSIRKTNDLGRKRSLIKSVNEVTDPSTGKRYSSSRIVIKFTEGDSDSKVSLFEEFCGGKLRSQVKSAGLYVFTVEPASYRRLSALIKSAVELDYVESAFLDEVKDMNPVSTSGMQVSDR